MPRLPNFSILIEDCTILTISFLKEQGYLIPNSTRQGVAKWNRNGVVTSSISLCSYTYKEERPYILLSYTWNKNEEIEYKVYLYSKPSNLRKGVVWYFICPITKKLCRKLYCADKYFLHREALGRVYYEKQLYSHKTRDLIKRYESTFTDNLYDEYYKKYRKKHYKGKSTKKEIQLQKKIDIAESYPPGTMERLMAN